MQIKHVITAVFVLFSIRGMAQTDVAFNYRKPLFDFDYQKPVFKLQGEQLINKNRLLRFSAVTGYREGVEPISGSFDVNFAVFRDSVSGIMRVGFYNSAIADLFTHGMVPHNMISLEVKDPSKYLYDPKYGDKESWMRKNARCYELALPLGAINDFKIVDSLLAQEFGVTFGMERRKANALVLVRTSKKDKLKSAGKGADSYDRTGRFNHVALNVLIQLMGKTSSVPVVDETGYSGPVDMDLKISSWADLPALRKALSKYDLDIKEEMRELELFVICETDYKNNHQ